MNKSKKRRTLSPSKKVFAYVRRMISSGKWVPNSKIPSMQKIADALSVSVPTVRKVIKILENEKIIENNYPLGFFVLCDEMVKRHKSSRISELIHKASIHVNAAKVSNVKDKIYGQYGIGYDKNNRTIRALNIITCQSITVNIDELNEMIVNPITIKRMLSASVNELPVLKRKYKRQKQIGTLARVVDLHRQELGISNG